MTLIMSNDVECYKSVKCAHVTNAQAEMTTPTRPEPHQMHHGNSISHAALGFEMGMPGLLATHPHPPVIRGGTHKGIPSGALSLFVSQICPLFLYLSAPSALSNL